MNTLVIVLIAAVCLFAGYTLYGRWLANKWGIDPKAKTPAVAMEDGQDYVPTDGWTVFAHQFSSIAGAGPVTGAIQAAAFGWLPVLLWVIIGGIFFGAVTDFGALYASVKNEGKSMGLLIEKYIGKTGRKLFLLFCWLFTLIVIAAFADMVAGTFNAYTVKDGVTELSAAAQTNGAAGSISLLFIVFAMVFGVMQKHLHLTGWKETVAGLACTVAALAIGMAFPLVAGKDTWSYLTFAYIFMAAVMPMWLLMQPRDYMTTFMFAGMIIGAVVGLLVAHPTMNLPVYTGFKNAKMGDMFPILFVTVACGAVSGFHSLVSSGTSSKTVSNEKDMLKVGYGAMVLESLLAVLALCVAGAAAAADGTAATLRQSGAAGKKSAVVEPRGQRLAEVICGSGRECLVRGHKTAFPPGSCRAGYERRCRAKRLRNGFCAHSRCPVRWPRHTLRKTRTWRECAFVRRELRHKGRSADKRRFHREIPRGRR